MQTSQPTKNSKEIQPISVQDQSQQIPFHKYSTLQHQLTPLPPLYDPLSLYNTFLPLENSHHTSYLGSDTKLIAGMQMQMQALFVDTVE